MSRVFCALPLLLLSFGLVAPAAAQTTFVETFDTSNEGAWTWDFGDSIPSSGGNPGAYLQTDALDAGAPQPRTSAATSRFVGDLAARDVRSIGADFVTLGVEFTTGGRLLTLMIVHLGNRPADPLDNTAACFVGSAAPLPGAPWKSYDFDVPAASLSIPAGWRLLNLGDTGELPRHSWNEVMRSVSEIRFFYGDPDQRFAPQGWWLGLDNPRITEGAAPPSCDEPSAIDLDPGAEPLLLAKAPGGLALTWGSSGAPAYELALGTIPPEGMAGRLGATGLAYDHASFGACALAATSATIASPPGDAYLLAVARCGALTSSYGRDALGTERPPSTTPCP
jgi:hypothetical protein